MKSRRAFLRMAGSGAALAVVAPPLLCAPAIAQAEITPQQFGAVGGDPVADTRGWNAAVEQAAAMGRPVIATGTYVLRVPAASHWNWGGPRSTTHIAVQLKSGTHVHGRGAQILIGPPEGPREKFQRHFIFGTNRNIAPGSLKDIVFDGLTFDFRDEFGPVHPFTYAVSVSGVDDFVRRNLTIRSSRARAGRGLMAENTRRRSDENIQHSNIVQGIFARYEYGVSMRHIAFDGFTEALDFDGPCWDVVLDDLSFKNGHGEAQCIDTGGGARWSITNVTAENVSSIVFIYVKDGPLTYEQWAKGGGEQKGRPSPTPPENFTVRGVRAVSSSQRKTGRHFEALRVGNNRRDKERNRPSPKDITIEDWSLKGGGRIVVNDCTNLQMHRITMSDNATPNDSVNGAALLVREADLALGGEVTGSISDIAIRNSQGMGLSVTAGPRLALNNISVDGFNLAQGDKTNAAIRMRPRKGTRDFPSLGAVDVKGNPSGAVAVDRE